MGLFSLPTRLTSQSASHTTTMPRDPTSKPRRRTSHSSKSSSAQSISSATTTIHSNIPREQRTSTHPAPTASDEDESDSPTVHYYPRTRTSTKGTATYIPPPAPTPPLVGSAPPGYSYVPVPVPAPMYKNTAQGEVEVEVDEDPEVYDRDRRARRKAEKLAAKQATLLPGGQGRKLIELPPARAGAGAVSIGSAVSTSGSNGSTPTEDIPVKSKLPILRNVGTGVGVGVPAQKQTVLQRVRLRAQKSLSQLPRVPLPPVPRPEIVLRIPLPNITFSRPNISFPRLPSLSTWKENAKGTVKCIGAGLGAMCKFIFKFLFALLLLLSLLFLYEFYPAISARYISPSASGVIKISETGSISTGGKLSMECTIDVSSAPESLIQEMDMKVCVDSGWEGWSGGMVNAPVRPGPIRVVNEGIELLIERGREYSGKILGEIEDKSTKLGYPTVADRVGEWRGWTAEQGRSKKRVCAVGGGVPGLVEVGVRYGAFLMSKKEKEECWERCRVGCLGQAARSRAVKAECKVSGGGRGGLGKCWGGYSLPKRA